MTQIVGRSDMGCKRQAPDRLTKAENKARRKQEQQQNKARRKQEQQQKEALMEALQRQEEAQQHEAWTTKCEAISSEVAKLRVIRKCQLQTWHSQPEYPVYAHYVAAGVFSVPIARRVLLHGLTRAVLNGREGYIKGKLDPSTQRILVDLCSRGTNTVERTISVKLTNVKEPRQPLLSILEHLDSFAGQLCWHVCKFFHRLMPKAKVWWLTRPTTSTAWIVRADFRLPGSGSDGEIDDSSDNESSNGDNESNPSPVATRDIRWKTPDGKCRYYVDSTTLQVVATKTPRLEQLFICVPSNSMSGLSVQSLRLYQDHYVSLN